MVGNLITGAGTVAQIGGGITTLTADNTYTGPTFVSNGVLRVNGNYTGGGLITVTDGARMGGSGTVGDITVESGGRIAPGNSIGTLTVANLTLQEGAILEWELSNEDNTSDLLVLGGIYGGFAPYTFDFMGTGYFDGITPTVYTLITFDSNVDGLGAGDFAVTNLGGSLTGDLAVNDNDITLTVVPEPTTLGTLGLLAVAALLRRRMKR
jgi:autotransporter-associated beta strand protein